MFLTSRPGQVENANQLNGSIIGVVGTKILLHVDHDVVPDEQDTLVAVGDDGERDSWPLFGYLL